MMQNGQKCAVNTSTSACRKKQTDIFLLNEDAEVSPSLLATKKMLNSIYQAVISIRIPWKHEAKVL